MIEEYAIVISCDNKRATLEVERRTACGLCGQKRGCGNATWGKLLGHKSHEFQAENPINAVAGDSVVVGLDEHAMLNSVFLLYVVPLLGLLFGAVLADVYLKNELLVILSAMSGLALGFLWVKGHVAGREATGKSAKGKCNAVILRHAQNVTEDVTNDGENNIIITANNAVEISVTKFQTKRGQ